MASTEANHTVEGGFHPVTMASMTQPKRGRRKRKGDRHKPGRQVRIRAVFLEALDADADHKGLTPPEVVNIALREYLVREGRWPAGLSKESAE